MTYQQFRTVKLAVAEVEPYVKTPAYDILKYSQNFESFAQGTGTPDGWIASAGTCIVETSTAVEGTRSLLQINSGATLSRTQSSMWIGRSYTLTAKAMTFSGLASTARIGVAGKGQTAAIALPAFGNPAPTLTYTFTATAGSHVLQLVGTESTLWDAVTITEHVPEEISTVIQFPITSGRFELNEGWSPYARARIEVPAVDPRLLDLLDPRDDVSIGLSVWREDENGEIDSARDATLQLRRRSIDHEAGTMTLDLYSDEVLLQRRLNKTKLADTSATAYQSSTRAIVNWALGKIGKSLEATPNPDRPFYVLENATNLCTNPSFQTNTTGWTIWAGTGGAATLSRPTSGGKEGAAYGRATWTTAASVPSAGLYTANVPLSGGARYTFAAWMRSSLAQKVNVGVEWKTSADAANGSNNGTVVTLAANTWTRVSLTATAPANTAKGNVTFYGAVGGTNWSVGSTLDVDGVTIVLNQNTPGIDYTAYFDGSSTATADYGYAWTGTAHASTSTRTALVDRSPDLLRWSPGQSLSDFLRSLLEVAGLRLFADEMGAWRLVDAEYVVPGRVTIAEGFNALTGTDDIDLDARADDGTPIYFDFVCLEYRWRDSSGEQQTAYDTAGTGDLGFKRTIERPYPGPGAAAYILGKALGRGRTQDVTGLVDYSVTPGQEVAITLPATIPQAGTVTAVDWDLDEDTMRVSSRGLADTPAGSWFFVGDTLTWTDVPGTTTWDNYTP